MGWERAGQTVEELEARNWRDVIGVLERGLSRTVGMDWGDCGRGQGQLVGKET